MTKLNDEEKIALAKSKIDNIANHLIKLLNVHETNQMVVFSSLLSDQIPKSYAAHAFNLFRDSLYEHELVVCTG